MCAVQSYRGYASLQDLTKDVLRIDAIPSTSLDGVKEWLGSMDIKFYESKVRKPPCMGRHSCLAQQTQCMPSSADPVR